MLTYINRLPVKLGLFGVSGELQFDVCNLGEPHANPCIAREGEHFNRGGKEVGGEGMAPVYTESMVCQWLSPCLERRGVFPFPV